MPYTQLQADSIRKTLDRLHARVCERFPDRGLKNLSGDVVRTFDLHMARLEKISRPHYGLRSLVALLLVGGLAAAGFGVAMKARLLMIEPSEVYSFEGIEAIVNILLLMGGGIWFLLNLETRRKRKQSLEGLHELRSIAHIIDMHQLTKDPATISAGPKTPSSPQRDLPPFELLRYLDYCVELLSLTGKIAALYMQRIDDSVVIEAANDVESLTSSLSSKIWQKITIVEAELRRIEHSGPALAPQTHPVQTISGDKK